MNKKKYDYLIVGAGLFGAVFGNRAKLCGKSCLVIDKRQHIAGNCFTKNMNGICVHNYGAHIFHTSQLEIWNFVRQFAEFNNFVNSPIAKYGQELYNLPFNLNTFNKLFGTITPEQAKSCIADQTKAYQDIQPNNLQEQAIKLVGPVVYQKLIKGYTQKQWGRPCDQLPTFIIKRLPLRWTYDNNYFDDTYQGIPKCGWTQMVANMLDGIEVELQTDYFEFAKQYPNIANKTVYTGTVDRFFDYCYGPLEYRSLQFEHKLIETDNFQGVAVVNHTSLDVPYTRTIEHRHFAPQSHCGNDRTIVSYEYPTTWTQDKEAYYPICDDKNNALYDKYKALQARYPNVIFGGRLAEYKYYDMDKVIASALGVAKRELNNK